MERPTTFNRGGRYLELPIILINHKKITLPWVPGHKKIPGNEVPVIFDREGIVKTQMRGGLKYWMEGHLRSYPNCVQRQMQNK